MKKRSREEHTPSTSESVTQGKRRHIEHSDNDDHQPASDNDVKKSD